MVLCGVLACLAAVLAVMPQPASGQLISNYSELNYSQWNQSEGNYLEGNYVNWSCARWYNRLEEALVADEEIIHVIQDTFFPITGRAPYSLEVRYDIQYISNGSLKEKYLLQGWSSSAVLSVLHPMIVLHWQPWLEVIIWLQGMIHVEPVNIRLSIMEDIGVLPPDPELKGAIMQLTSWIRMRIPFYTVRENPGSQLECALKKLTIWVSMR